MDGDPSADLIEAISVGDRRDVCKMIMKNQVK